MHAQLKIALCHILKAQLILYQMLCKLLSSQLKTQSPFNRI